MVQGSYHARTCSICIRLTASLKERFLSDQEIVEHIVVRVIYDRGAAGHSDNHPCSIIQPRLSAGQFIDPSGGGIFVSGIRLSLRVLSSPSYLSLLRRHTTLMGRFLSTHGPVHSPRSANNLLAGMMTLATLVALALIANAAYTSTHPHLPQR